MQSQNSHGLASLPHLSPRPNSSDQNICVKGAKVLCECACMHASSHAAIILMGAEWDPETRTFLCVNTNDHSRGEKESKGGFKEHQRLQCKPQRNMLKCTRSPAPLLSKCQCIFPFLPSTPTGRKCSIETSYDSNPLSVRRSGCLKECNEKNDSFFSIYLLNLLEFQSASEASSSQCNSCFSLFFFFK